MGFSLILTVESLVKTYGSRKVLDIDHLFIENPGVYSFLGPNGAGKTTLFNVITGIVKPDSGRIRILGYEPGDTPLKKLLAYCTQDHGLIGNLTGIDNALFYGRLYGLSSSEVKERLYVLSEELGLSKSDLRLKVGKYSGGMKRKLSIAISILHDPALVVLDEPTTGLDPASRRSVWSLIKRMREESKTVFVATHYMEEADFLSDRVFIMNQGKIIAEGRPDELKERYGPKSVVELVLERVVDDRVLEAVKTYTDKFAVDGNLIRIQVEEPEEKTPLVIHELFRRGYVVNSFKLVKPTLEDVFLKLTGRRLVD